MTVSRRHLLGAGAGLLGGLSMRSAQAAPTPSRGPVANAVLFGLKPGLKRPQTKAFVTAIKRAERAGVPLFLPAGDYRIGGVTLSGDVHIHGVPGKTRLLAAGGHLLALEDCGHVTLSGITFDGRKKPMKGDHGGALVNALNVGQLDVTHCHFTRSGSHGLVVDGCTGQVSFTRIDHVAETGLVAVDCDMFEIGSNTLLDCGNNGIQVWRRTQGHDGTRVINNQVRRIRADRGSNGPYGNGINVFRAGNVLVAQNLIEDCAFSAIRGNSASGIQMIGNNCARLGEVAVYSEFTFEGAVITNNIIDTAAHGISVANFREGGRISICSHNIIRNIFLADEPEPRGAGIFLEADSVVEGNVIENAGTGLVLGWGRYFRDVTALNNVIRQCGTGITASVTKGAGSALIANNIVSGSKDNAMAAMDHGKVIAPDLDKPETARKYSHLAIRDNFIT